MKNGAKWYQRFPHTFLGGIQGMSAQDIAVYSVTLDLIYHHGGRVNNDPKWISGWINDMGSAAVRSSIARLAERDLLTISGHGISAHVQLDAPERRAIPARSARGFARRPWGCGRDVERSCSGCGVACGEQVERCAAALADAAASGGWRFGRVGRDDPALRGIGFFAIGKLVWL